MEPQKSIKNLEEITSFANRFTILFLTSSILSKIIIMLLQKSIIKIFEDALSNILVLGLILIFVLIFGSCLFRTTPKEIILGKRTAPKLPAIDSIFLTLSLFFFEWGIVLLSMPFLKRYSPDEFNPESLFYLTLSIIGPCILGPVNEEIIFRRIGFQYAEKYGTMFAVITSSVIFAFAHGISFQTFVALLLGLCAGILCARTGTILWPILLHMAHNGFDVAMGYLFPFYEGIPSFRYYLLLTVFAMLCVICFFLYAARQKINLQKISIKTTLKKFREQIRLDGRKYKAYFTSTGALIFFLFCIISFLGQIT
ncbi:hypothetical protein OBV_27210 [Oscillibacter valericigenes Sjm18-20]|nr:hypothetical protein OBV_27210 [Oscillibacter valericigenes Sjm18-20]